MSSQPDGPTGHMIGRKTEDADMEEEALFREKSGRRTVAEALDDLQIGHFHVLHLLRMVLAWAIFSMTQESTPYMFQGLRLRFQADEDRIATFAAAFPLGCAIGACVASPLLDHSGRRGTLLNILPCAAMLSLAAGMAPNMLVLNILRMLQAVAFSVAITGMSAWYIEFLPTSTRGMLMAAYSVGWPIGRAIVIWTAAWVKEDWTQFMALAAWGFVVFFTSMYYAHESPRFLAASGRAADAARVLKEMYQSNGQGVWEHRIQIANSDGLDGRSRFRELILVKENRNLLIFAMSLFVMLASTTVLLDTWGPRLYRDLLAPGASGLPHGILMLFNLGDFAGIVLSILVIDHIGRCGSFVIGFIVQGCLLFLLTLLSSSGASSLHAFAVACGTLSSACRCFAWESAQMWTLEVFPTQIRATAFSVAMTVMRLASILSLKVSAQYIGILDAANSLRILAALLLASGLFSTLLLPKETAKVPMTEADADVKAF